MTPEQSDIVTRLRERAGKYDEYDWHSAIELEAAQEIHNLRAIISARLNSEPVAYRWKWDKNLEWHYGEYLCQRDYYASEQLYTLRAPLARSQEEKKK